MIAQRGTRWGTPREPWGGGRISGRGNWGRTAPSEPVIELEGGDPGPQ